MSGYAILAEVVPIPEGAFDGNHCSDLSCGGGVSSDAGRHVSVVIVRAVGGSDWVVIAELA